MTPSFKGEQRILLKNVGCLDLFHTKPNYRRVWQWTKYGVDGIRLESRREGRRRITSVEAVQRFLEATQ